MGVEPLSFLLGLGAMAAVALVVWLLRARLRRIQSSAEDQLEGTRRFIGRSASARYARDMARYAQDYHVAAGTVALGDVLVEPRLIRGPQPLAQSDGDDPAATSVFDVIPVFHDLPQSYAPYNLETLSLPDLGRGDRQIAILGLSGAGKSTALATLALIALGELQFETLEEMTEQAIFEEEQYLSEEERAERVQERERLQARALEKLHDARQPQRDTPAEPQQPSRQPSIDIAGLVPVLVHLREIELTPGRYGKHGMDPAEPLVEAAQQQVSAVTARVVGSVIYPALEAGRALVLIDGYDELTDDARESMLPWLRSLIEIYGRNLIVVTGPAVGFEPLQAAGFTATFIRPWRDDDFALLVQRWSAAWTAQARGRRGETAIDEQTQRRLTINNRGRTPLDITLKVWTALAGDAQIAGRAGWYDAYVNRRLSRDGIRDALPILAGAALDHGGALTQATAQEALADAEPPDGKSLPKADDALDTLAKDRLLRTHSEGVYSFVHPQIASYLASEALIAAGADAAAEYAMIPAWQDALGFAAAQLNMLPIVYRRLSTPPDLLFSSLFELVHWMPDAPVDAPWRGDLFKRLAAALMAPDQFPALRARAMAALIASHDRNVLFILRQALRSADPTIRQLACVGLGALGDPEALRDLAPMLDDTDRHVQLAAGLALGAIGTERALEIMVQGLLEGSDELRRAVAEALAAIPDGGHEILRDGIQADDIMIRRATVYGLSRVRAPWALVALFRAMMEDEQWYVRAAAEEAFLATRTPDKEGPHAHPEADALVWLIEWAAQRGEGVPAGASARQVLIRVLQEGQPLDKVIAALTLGRLGHTQALKPLYAALRDRDPQVRAAAFTALADLQLRIGAPLPSVA